jgi:hypothetical protein
VGGPVDAQVRDGRRPLQQPVVEPGPGAEAPPGEPVALDVLDPAFRLALRLGPIRLAGAWGEPPVTGEVLEDRVPDHAPALAAEDLGAGIVVQTFKRYPPEVPEGPFVSR